ncbi:helix-turn-helix domain-containing protein [Spirochaeta dissipatitropha]
MKKPHIEISGDSIPEELIHFLKSHYQDIEIIADDEQALDITDTEWYQEMKENSSPGSTLKRYRRRAEMSQRELAEKLEMVKQNISAMEKGRRGISKRTAHKLAEIFQVSPARFI